MKQTDRVACLPLGLRCQGSQMAAEHHLHAASVRRLYLTYISSDADPTIYLQGLSRADTLRNDRSPRRPMLRCAAPAHWTSLVRVDQGCWWQGLFLRLGSWPNGRSAIGLRSRPSLPFFGFRCSLRPLGVFLFWLAKSASLVRAACGARDCRQPCQGSAAVSGLDSEGPLRRTDGGTLPSPLSCSTRLDSLVHARLVPVPPSRYVQVVLW